MISQYFPLQKMFSFFFVLQLVFAVKNLCAQPNANANKFMPKRMFDKIEVVLGANYCFNHGSKFVDTYSSPNFNNNREFKMGYTVGIGLYHPVNKWLDINLKLSWDQKGTSSKFVTAPTDSGYHNLVTTVKSNYSYNYITLSVIPRIFFGKKKRYAFLIGGYYSITKKVNAHVLWESHNDNYSVSSDQSFSGRQVYGIDNNGGITSSGTAIGLISFNNDYGAVIGFSYFIPLKKSHGISIQLTENYGIVNINKQVFAPPAQNPPEKNNAVCFTIGYMYCRSNSH